MVFQRSMLDWRRGVESVCHEYMCILLYMKLIWCSDFPEIYVGLEEGGVVVLQRSMLDCRRGVESVCHGYMTILLYMNLIWCSGLALIYG